jgi:octaprenyl-diphosphate synthase
VADLRDIIQLVEEDLARVEEIFEAQFRSDVGWWARSAATSARAAASASVPPCSSWPAGCAGTAATRHHPGLGRGVHPHRDPAHDDIIDEATVRRGKRSVNSRWGNDITVLLGDFLYTKSMSMALSQDNLPILRLLSDVTLRMIEGELLEIERNGDLRMSEAQHLDIIRRKTADLSPPACPSAPSWATSARTSGGPSPATAEPGHLLPDGGRPLDFTADEKVLGKPVNNDLAKASSPCPSSSCCARPDRRARRRCRTSWPTAASSA